MNSKVKTDRRTRCSELTAAQEVPIGKVVIFNFNKNSTFSCNLIWNKARV